MREKSKNERHDSKTKGGLLKLGFLNIPDLPNLVLSALPNPTICSGYRFDVVFVLDLCTCGDVLGNYSRCSIRNVFRIVVQS